MKKLVEDESIDCDFVLTRCCDVSMTESIYADKKAGVDMFRKHGLAVIKDVYFTSGPQAEQVRRSPDHECSIH